MGVIICHSLNALKRLSMNYLMLTGGHKKGNKETDEDEVWDEEEGWWKVWGEEFRWELS